MPAMCLFNQKIVPPRMYRRLSSLRNFALVRGLGIGGLDSLRYIEVRRVPSAF